MYEDLSTQARVLARKALPTIGSEDGAMFSGADYAIPETAIRICDVWVAYRQRKEESTVGILQRDKVPALGSPTIPIPQLLANRIRPESDSVLLRAVPIIQRKAAARLLDYDTSSVTFTVFPREGRACAGRCNRVRD